MWNERLEVSNFMYAVIEGEDERGNPIYGEPKFFDKDKEREEEN